MMNEYVKMTIELPPMAAQLLKDEMQKQWRLARILQTLHYETLPETAARVILERFADRHKWNVPVEEDKEEDREGMKHEKK